MKKRSMCGRSTGILVLMGCVVLGMFGGIVGAEGDLPGGAQVDALVAQLGADKFSLREEATRRLWELGPVVVPALREACQSEDPEVRLRARAIVADLELGILVDTPAETVALLREYHAAGFEQKKEILQRLRGDAGILPRMRLLLSEKNPDMQEELVREFAGTGDQLLEALRETGRLDEAEELLAIVSPRSWAVFLLQNGEAEARAEAMREKWKEGRGTVDAAALVWLLLVTDQVDAARAVGEQAGDPGLRREVYLRQRDWKAMLEVGKDLGSNDVERLGFKAWFLSKAGDAVGRREAIADLLALDLDDDRMAGERAVALLILGEFDAATRCFQEGGALDSDEFGFYVERMEFDALADRLGVDPSGNDVGKEMEDRIAKAVKMAGHDGLTARRELFNLCRTLGEFLVRVGRREDARQVLVAAKELVRDEASYLSYLARTFRSAGFVEEAEAIELEALDRGGEAHQLSLKFPRDRVLSQFWWDFLRSRYPDEGLGETMDRIAGILEPPEDGGAEARDAALAEALEWVEKQGTTDRAKYHGALADHYERENDWEAAARHLRKQSELSKTAATPLLEAGDMFASQKQWDRAAEFYAEAREADPGSELAMYLHGWALVEDGRREEGEVLKAEAIRMPLANSNRRTSLASNLSRRGLTDEAWQQWDLLLKTAAHDNWDGSDFWILRSIRMQLASRIDDDDPALAADCLEFYLMSFLKTNTSMTIRSYLGYHTRIEALRFEACLAAQDLDGASGHVRRWIAVRPSSVAPVLEAVAQLEEAGRDDAAGEYHASLVELYSGAIARFPLSARYHSALAEVRFGMGDREAAIALAERCVELDPDSSAYAGQLERFTGEEPEGP